MNASFVKKSIMLAVAAAILLSVFGCALKNEPVLIEVSGFTAVPVPTPAPISADVRLDTLAPVATPEPFSVSPTPYVSPAPYTSPVPVFFTPLPPGIVDQRVFDNCAFVGNSLFEALHAYGVVSHGSFFTTVGLNIDTVYTASSTHGSIPVINELNTGHYMGVILMFGQNELGWPNMNVFIQKYARLISDVRSRQPGARIFVTGMPPVTKALSDKNKDGVTNANINYVNSMLEYLASQFGYCRYISVPDEMYDDYGALPASASGDGIHLNMTYSRIWAEHLCRAVAAGLSS